MLCLLTQREAAAVLCLSERTLERLRVSGTGPRFVRAGRSVRYREADLEAWIAAPPLRPQAHKSLRTVDRRNLRRDHSSGEGRDGMNVPGLGDLLCFPLNRKKEPLIHAWHINARRIEPLLSWPLVGVPTGDVHGFDVLDVDPRGLEWLAAIEDSLPPTRRHQTKRGVHLLFRHARDLTGSTDRIADGVDVRANGNYIAWWPRQGLAIVDAPLAEWPPGLLEKAWKTAKVHSTRSGHGMETSTSSLSPMPIVSTNSREGRYSHAALRNAFGHLANWPKVRDPKTGKWERRGRNEALNKLAYKMGGLVANGWIDQRLVIRVLMLAATDCRLVQDDGAGKCEATIMSGLSAGMQAPYPPLGEPTRAVGDDTMRRWASLKKSNQSPKSNQSQSTFERRI
jgi:excisionase family DNA binding protein